MSRLSAVVGLIGTGFYLYNQYLHQVQQNASLLLTLDLSHRRHEHIPSSFFSLTEPQLTHFQLLRAIELAAKDERVKGIIANVTPKYPLSLAQVEELRSAIQHFNSSQPSKLSVAFAQHFGETQNGLIHYWLASVFKKVMMQPTGDFALVSLYMQTPFFKTLLDSLNIQVEVEKRKDYKTAPNMMTEDGFTASHRETMMSLGRGWFDQIVNDIALSRNFPCDYVKAIIELCPLPNRQSVLYSHFIDWLIHEHQLHLIPEQMSVKQQLLSQRHLTTDQRDLLNLAEQTLTWMKINEDVCIDSKTKPLIVKKFDEWAFEALSEQDSQYRQAADKGVSHIALIHAIGPVVNEPVDHWKAVPDQSFNAVTLAHAIKQAAGNEAVKTIVVRIDSPGGSALASDVVYNALHTARHVYKKQIVVSMGDVCASGGYYVAAAANHIFSNKTTVTGSIGVFSGRLAMRGFLEQKLKLKLDQINVGSDNENGSYFSLVDPLNPFLKQRLSQRTDSIYADFKSKVSEGRNLTADQVECVAQGKVWLGREALKVSLVDRIGSITDAISYARSISDVSSDMKKDLPIVEYPREKPLSQQIIQELTGVIDSHDPLFQSSETTVQAKIRALMRQCWTSLMKIKHLAELTDKLQIDKVADEIGKHTKGGAQIQLKSEVDSRKGRGFF